MVKLAILEQGKQEANFACKPQPPQQTPPENPGPHVLASQQRDVTPALRAPVYG